MAKATEATVNAIEKMSQKVNGKEHIAMIASISAADEEVGNMIADAMERFLMTVLLLLKNLSLCTQNLN